MFLAGYQIFLDGLSVTQRLISFLLLLQLFSVSSRWRGNEAELSGRFSETGFKNQTERRGSEGPEAAPLSGLCKCRAGFKSAKQPTPPAGGCALTAYHRDERLPVDKRSPVSVLTATRAAFP